MNVETPMAPTAVAHDPFAQAVLRVVPTTEAQREIWLVDRLDREASLAYNEALSMRIDGPFDHAALKQALGGLVQRHDVLRSVLSGDGQTLCVLEHATTAMAFGNLLELGAAEQGARIAQAEIESVSVPFDLQDGPLFRATLFRLGPQSHRLLLSAHHAICDGWSWWVLVRDLGALYGAALEDRPASLPPAESFADHALAEATQSGHAHAGDEGYWHQRFSDGVPVLELPLDLPRPHTRHFASRREELELPPELLHALRETAAKQGCSLFSLMLSAFALLVARIAGQDDVVIGIPSAGQPASGKLALVGHCANTLPMRFALRKDEAFATFLAHANNDLLDAVEHRGCTLSTLLQHLAIARDPSRVPLASLLFNIDQSLEGESAAFAGARIDCRGVARIADNFELSLNAVQTPAGMRLECQYAASLLHGSTVRRWLRAYRMLLRGVVEHIDRPGSAYGLLDDDDVHELATLSPHPTSFHRERLMHQHFEASCDRRPDAVAAHDGRRGIRYGELDREANRIAHLLSVQGVKPGDLVGIAVDRGIPMLAALLGILKAGAGYIPLDPAFPAVRLQHMLDDGRPSAVLTTDVLAMALPLHGQRIVLLDDAALSAQPDTRLQSPGAADPEAIAYVIYTSGSTGTPKGVEIPHRAVANFLASMAERPGLHQDDVLVAVTTLSFDIAVLELMLPLCVGAQVVIADRETTLDGGALAACIAEHRATVMQATPATWRTLIEADWVGSAGFRVLCGGESLPATLAAQLLARSREVWNVYGPTETTVWSTCARIAPPARGMLPDIHIGRPIANTSVWILDDANLPCLRGIPGELCISGEGLARGYRNQPALTADRFIDWNGPDGRLRLYRTGDRARWRDDGMLEHLGRLDHQIKLRGYRIELGEIETRLASHPDVQSAVVLVREENEGDARLLAYVVMVPGREIEPVQLKTHLRGSLPDYMIPQHVMVLAQWPLTANGKIDRKALPLPGAFANECTTSAAAESPLQERLLEAFKSTLKLGMLGIDDDFFLSGGHSLLAAQLTTRLKKEFALHLSQRTLFDAPTVRKLSRIIDGNAAANTESQSGIIARREHREWAPLSIFQQRQALIHEFHPEVLAYSLPSGHVLNGALDLEHFRQALTTVVNRQTVLRTGFERRGDDLVQVLRSGLESRVLEPLIDLTHLAPAQRQDALETDIRTLVARPFESLADAPLFRSRLYRMADDEHVWFFMPHQIIWDGWSFDLLYAELSECYAALCAGREPSLPALPVDYGDYAIWHNAWMESDAYRGQREQWRQWMCMPNARGGWPRALPTDRPRPRLMTGTATAIPLELSPALSQSLRETAKSLDSTVFVVMLAAWFVALAHYGGDPDVVVGTPVRGRHHAETEPLMGHIVNLLPLRMDVPMTGVFADVVRLAKSSLLDSLSAPDIQLEDIAEMRSGLPGVASSILYHAQFSFQDIRDRITHWGELSHRRFDIDQPSIAEDLNLWVVDRGDGGLQGTLLYNRELLEERTARRIAGYYQHLLAELAGDPRQAIEAALHSLNDTSHDMSATMEHASAAPSALATVTRLDYLQALWERHLGVSVGPGDNFFDLGGSSMQAVRVLVELARDTGVKLRLPQLAVQTAAEIAAQLPERNIEPANSGWFKRIFGRK
ncbi:non-ribosomal peptide synthetase [Solilutibacter silvestris]|uniref:AA-adenyl-dom: amino acid adenylation domain n=1 Tax=Solilutibacter silvestris TaxID=1645665 RepID=A0A2K1PZB8_9GAMM|nr:non-ribosomal peptide synthetase [Lysobacter silvestris]PNS08134.1 AA-adenyl-dom: amino acid adenylation domain [Lysobacter silvestris]